MPALCSTPDIAYYAQNYALPIGAALLVPVKGKAKCYLDWATVKAGAQEYRTEHGTEVNVVSHRKLYRNDAGSLTRSHEVTINGSFLSSYFV